MKLTHQEHDPADAARWEAIEQATELLLEDEHHEAMVLLRDAIKRDRGNYYAYYYVGTAMFETGRFDAAIDAYRAALRLKPDYRAARIGLSHALRIEGEHQLALIEARKVLDQAPGDSDALFAMGLAQALMGQRVEAIRTLEAFLDSGPEFEIAVEARAMLEKLRAAGPDNDQHD